MQRLAFGPRKLEFFCTLTHTMLVLGTGVLRSIDNSQ